MNEIEWDHTPEIRIRQATAADLDGVAKLTPLASADFELETPLMDAVIEGFAGAGLLIGLRDGTASYRQHMGKRFATKGKGPMRACQEAMLTLVAEHGDEGVIGTLIAYPAIGLITKLIGEHQADPRLHDQIFLVGTIGLATIKAIAVAEPFRRSGVGSSFIKHCTQVYDQCGYKLLYGQMPPRLGLDSFYRRSGFNVLRKGASIDLGHLFGFKTSLGALGQDRMFFRKNP